MEAPRTGSNLNDRLRLADGIGLSLAIAGVVIAAYFPALSADFLYWDDDKNFLDNHAWRGLSFEHLKWMATTCHGGPYQPFSWLTLGANYAWGGMDPRGYHFTNVLLHALTAIAFFFLAARLLPLAAPALAGRARRPSAAAAALLFALHPLRVESVAWITERRDVLSGLFFVLSLVAYVDHATGARGRRPAYAVSLVCLLLSLLAKASGMVAPLLLLLLDLWPLRRPIRRAIVEKIPFVLLVLPFAGVALWGQATQTGVMSSLDEHGILERLAQAAYATVFYLAKTVLPLGLIPIHELPSPLDPLELRFVGAAIVVVASTLLLYWKRRSLPAGWTAWAAYLVVLAPVSGLVHVGPQLVADRYSYLACMPFALLGAGAMFAYAGRVAIPVTLAIVGTLAVLTWKQSRLWNDTETLFTHVLAVAPRSYVAHDLVGRMKALHGLDQEAADHYRASIEIAPAHPIPRNNLGLLLLEEGRVDDAIEQFRSALEHQPDYAKARSHLGVALMRADRLAEAEAELREGMRRNPRDSGTHQNLGILLVRQDRLEEAASEFEIVLAIDPRSTQAHRLLAQVYGKLGKADLANEHLRLSRARP